MVMLSTQSKTNNSLIAKRNYTFDAVGRVAARIQTRGTDTARNDSCGYNDRSELTSATLGTDDFAYSFDNIGNRMTTEELADEIAYSANNLNQYTAIEKSSGTPFEPTFDDDGNQLTVQTATGVWNVTYNAENRPISFTQGTTVIECKYDSMGRRFEKKVTTNNVITFWQRYAYKGYLQIAAFNVLIVDEAEVLSLATTTYWDPTEPTATRPLAFTDYTVAPPATYFYTHDLTKNVCEILSRDGSAVSITTTYDYTPFGAVTASNSATSNTFMFSSEVLDPETNLVYYNYRHYNPNDGRWISRDPIAEQGGWNLYAMAKNNAILYNDLLGLVTHDEYGVLQPKKEQEGIPCDINNVGKKIFSKTEFVRLELKIKKNGIVQDLPSKVTAKVATKLLGKQIEAMDKAAHQGVVVIWGKKIKTIVTVEKICICTGENSYKWEFVSRSITTQTEKIPTSIFLSEELK